MTLSHSTFGLLVLALATPGVCREWSDPADTAALCAMSSPVSLPATGEGDECAMMWLEVAQNARDYARERAQWLGEPHEVTIASPAYATPRYDHDLGILTIPFDDPISIFGGTDYIRIAEPMATFEMTEAEAEVLISQYRAGSLSLRLVFGLTGRSRPDAEICTVTPEGDRVISVSVETAELLQPVSSHSHCRMQTVNNVRSVLLYGPNAGGQVQGAIPIVEVGSISLEDPEDETQDATTERELPVLSAFIEAALIDCYAEGLDLNPRAQGVLTLTAHYDATGTLQDPEIVRDHLNNPILTSCVIRELGAMTLWHDADREDTAIRATVLFRQ